MYEKMKEIIEANGEIIINEKKNAQLRFPVYITAKMHSDSIDCLDLSMRSTNCLKRAGINTITDLTGRVSKSADLQNIRNCGRKSVCEIMEQLFLYQYKALAPERRERYLAEVIKLSGANVLEQ